MIRRVVLIVLDSVGIGALPDAHLYGDAGAHTLSHIDRQVGGLQLPNMQTLGLGNIDKFIGIKRVKNPIGSYGKLAIASCGKDTNIGHWELAGLVQKKPFPTYPNGFPQEIITPFCKAIRRDILGNTAASGTEIIKQLGAEHLRTGCPIVYTSADSVFQIAAHEDIIPLNKLYKICETARRLLIAPHNVLRVIARPFTGTPDAFIRTPYRRDFALPPPEDTLLDKLQQAGITVIGIGKIGDIFSVRGIKQSRHTKSNQDGMAAILKAMNKYKSGLIFANLVDFDMLYGHRNDVSGYERALCAFDTWLPRLSDKMRPDDLLIITSDHGCDPTYAGTDHTREYALLLVYGKNIAQGVNLGAGSSLSNVGQSIADIFKIGSLEHGVSFYGKIKA